MISPSADYESFFGKDDDKKKEEMVEDVVADNASAEDVTPNILLEQLAYVDNFFPSLDQDFASVDTWMLGDNHGANASNNNNNTNNNTTTTTPLFEPPGGLDEQLSVELSVFADDAFIFPDEDKRNQDRDADSDRDGNPREGPRDNQSQNQGEDQELLDLDSGRAGRSRNPHFLTERRSNFLMSQYDHSRARFSSNRKRQQQNEERRRSDDHGEFTNVNIGTPTNTTPPSMDTLNSPVTQGEEQGQVDEESNVQSDPVNVVKKHRPSVSSPLNNVIANSSQWNSQYSNSNSNNNTSNNNDIELPNYSSIPTSTLVSLLPRVKVPPGAYNTLISLGFSSDQVDAMSALIAYNEQQKNRNGELINHNNISNEDSLKTLLDLFNAAPAPERQGVPQGNLNIQQPLVQQQQQQQQNVVQSPCENETSPAQTNGISRRDSEFLDSILKMQAASRTGDNVQKKGEEKKSKNEKDMEPILRTKSETQVKDSNERPQERKDSLTRTHSLDTNLDDHSSKKRERSVSFDEDEDDEDDPYSSSKRSSVDSTGRAQKPADGSKRKIKEKELETSIQELSELAVSLQQKIHTLEMENKLLKNLVLSSGDLNMVGLESTPSKTPVGKKANVEPAGDVKN